MMTHTPSASRYALSFTSCRTARETSLPLHPAVEEDGMLYAEVTVEAPLSWPERLRAHAAGNGGAS